VSTAAIQSPVGAHPIRPRDPRFPAAIPVDITVLRSGIPYNIPGRAINFCQGGLGAMLAGELVPGDVVGIAFGVPEVESPIRTRAQVRHQARLRCGLSFVGLSAEQQMIIERWSRRMADIGSANRFQELAGPRLQEAASVPLKPQESRQRYRMLWLVLVILLVIGAGGWWRWYQSWQDLESRLQKKEAISQVPPIRVPASVMEQLLIHKVEPVLPGTEPSASRGGAVVLNAVIGADGTVMKLRPLSGPDSLASAATDAVRWWRYQPYLVNGQPVEVETTVTVNFQTASTE
jgi:Gram-negative bacterial TonB protein C-terminal/PilZ domain